MTVGRGSKKEQVLMIDAFSNSSFLMVGFPGLYDFSCKWVSVGTPKQMA